MPLRKNLKNSSPVKPSQSIRKFFQQTKTVNEEKETRKKNDAFDKDCSSTEICLDDGKKEKKVTKEVTVFFPRTKKNSSAGEKENVEKKMTENFYDKCLNTKKCQCDQKETCLKIKINELKEKMLEYENMVKTARSVIEEKEEKINRLQENVCLDVAAKNTTSTQSVSSSFESFSVHFKPEQLECLRLINSDERGDSTFVLNAIKFLYDGRLHTLETKTACGRKIKDDKAKTMMTPQTKLIVERIYTERLDLLGIGALQHNVRRKKINKLIKDAFINIKKSNQKKETCRRLQFEKIKE